jgi:hypothetical protein
MPIDKSLDYEIHRPLSYVALQAVSTALLPEEQQQMFTQCMENAAFKTGGPMMYKGGVGCLSGDEMDYLYLSSLKKGIEPCYVDKRDKFVYVGEYVFVPSTLEVYRPPEG